MIRHPQKSTLFPYPTLVGKKKGGEKEIKKVGGEEGRGGLLSLKEYQPHLSFFLFLVLISIRLRKKRDTGQTQTKKQLEWYLPNNVVWLQ